MVSKRGESGKVCREETSSKSKLCGKVKENYQKVKESGGSGLAKYVGAVSGHRFLNP